MRITIVLLMCVLFTQARRVTDKGSQDKKPQDSRHYELSVSQMNQIIKAIIREASRDLNRELSPYSLLKKTKERMRNELKPKFKIQLSIIKEAFGDYIASLLGWEDVFPTLRDVNGCLDGSCIFTAIKFIGKMAAKAELIKNLKDLKIFQNLGFISQDLKDLGNLAPEVDYYLKRFVLLLKNIKRDPDSSALRQSYYDLERKFSKNIKAIRAKFASFETSKEEIEQRVQQMRTVEVAKLNKISGWIAFFEENPEEKIEKLIPDFATHLREEFRQKINMFKKIDFEKVNSFSNQDRKNLILKKMDQFAPKMGSIEEEDAEELYH